mgnify:CR=1 FL=1
MPNYLYTPKPEYPIVEKISFNTEVIEQDSLFHAPVGSPAQFNTYTYNSVLMPAPQFPIEETTKRETLISQLNPFEQRRSRHEAPVLSNMLSWQHITHEERNTLVDFFLSRKGKFDNFYIQYPTLFAGVNTLVRFNADTLESSLDSYKLYSASIEIRRAVNGRYIQQQINPRREFIFPYKESDLAALKTWLNDTAVGRYTAFTLDMSQIASYLSGSYTCRLKNDEFTERYTGVQEKIIEVELIEVTA